jgi:hypothetical protein
MSSLLFKSFNDLTVSCPISSSTLTLMTSLSQINTPTSASEPIVIDIPAQTAHGRTMHYGFGVDQEWLAEYGRNLYTEPLPDCDHMSYMTLALDHLKRLTRIKSLKFQPALLGSEAPQDTKWIMATSGVKVVLVIAVCSSKRRSFERRPAQAALDHLAQLLGGIQPMWWTTSR